LLRQMETVFLFHCLALSLLFFFPTVFSLSLSKKDGCKLSYAAKYVAL